MRILQSRSLALALIAVARPPVAGCAGRGGAKKGDVPYVARDVGTLYIARQAPARPGPATRTRRSLFDEVERQHPYSIWARRAQLMSAFSYYLAQDYTEVDPVGAALPVGPSGQPRRALCLLPRSRSAITSRSAT